MGFAGGTPRARDPVRRTSAFDLPRAQFARRLSRAKTRRPSLRSATHSAFLPCGADGCIARMIRRPNRASQASDTALLPS
jgi:hypothetical protein